jgi:hypothetical protein
MVRNWPHLQEHHSFKLGLVVVTKDNAGVTCIIILLMDSSLCLQEGHLVLVNFVIWLDLLIGELSKFIAPLHQVFTLKHLIKFMLPLINWLHCCNTTMDA